MNSVDARLVRVSLGSRAYDVEVGVGLMGSLGRRVRAALGCDQTGETPVPPEPVPPEPVPLSPVPPTPVPPVTESNSGRAFVVVDDNLPDEFVEPALQSLRDVGFDVSSERIVALETNKSLDTAGRLLRSVAATRHERGEPIIALGGGITGDIAGFVAASYRRGVPIIQCPTTLLAMVDASVGGKTGVNLTVGDSLVKNMVGAFWQPRLVLTDIAALRSLADRQFRCGLAECLKHGMIGGGIDADLLDWTIANLSRLHCRDERALAELVARNVAVKARFVERDEREESSGAQSRALLNLGHTFAHAIETIGHLTPDGDPAHAPLLHGEAVALGLVAAAVCAREIGLIDDDTLDRVTGAIAKAGLPTRVADLPATGEILDAMGHDKKVVGGRLRLVLPIGAGRARLVDDAPEQAIRAAVEAIRAEV